MIVTSFDIGVRNLSYCTLEYCPQNLSGNQFKINDWNVIDILTNEDKTQKKRKKQTMTCSVQYKSGTKKGQPCGQLAHFSRVENGQTLWICRSHSKSFDDIERAYTVSNVTPFEIATLAVKQLDKIDFSPSDLIILESQPSFNPKMKNLSMMIFNYFVIRYIVDKQQSEHKIRDVKFISSSNKLTIYDGPYIECTLKNPHGRNKFYGKKYCEYLIRYNSKIDFYRQHVKKDDLADSFLQGAWYLMKNYKGGSVVIPKITLKPKIFLKSNLNQETQKPKIVMKTNPNSQISGHLKLLAIKNNPVTKMIHNDINGGRYRQLKRGYKPTPKQLQTGHYTLSNLKYIVEKNRLVNNEKIVKYSVDKDPHLLKSINYYFDDLNNFVKIINV